MRRRLPCRLPTGTTIAEALDVSLTLGGTRILDGVSLSIRTGEVLALVGPNGAGKSTLLSVLSGDHTPDAGTVHLAGQPLTHWSPVETAMRRAVMLQQATISFPFTVADLVAMGRAPWYGTTRADDDEPAVQAALETADITEFRDRVFSSLSGGERARVSLARALAQQAQLLLLDEPTAALDLHHQEAVLQLARTRAAHADAIGEGGVAGSAGPKGSASADAVEGGCVAGSGRPERGASADAVDGGVESPPTCASQSSSRHVPPPPAHTSGAAGTSAGAGELSGTDSLGGDSYSAPNHVPRPPATAPHHTASPDHAGGGGDAVVVVVHDLNLAAGYADRVVVLSGGKVVADGPPGVVLTAELLSEVYRHPVEVWAHPGTGGPVILPRR
ncbi:ATP-binding cassette domain-containing protein [Kribbella sp. NPDC056951]|uniref:ATP-binding cassette domain-containing protein n=1 Tax=Kribbella sp. NPDC056951 TaxID=3345978 RepID=UPI00363D9A0E